MSSRLRDHSPTPRDAVDDRAVSPVVGMILVLAISIVGIAAILYWGLPTIDEMKANVEFRSLESQFYELDATIKELVAGTTDKTAKRWTPAINRGSVNIYNNTEAWVYAVTLNNSTANLDFDWTRMDDGDNVFRVHYRNMTPLAPVGSPLILTKIEAYLVTGTSSLTPLNVTRVNASGYQQMTGTDLVAWTNNTWEEFRVLVKDATTTPQNLHGGIFKFRIFSGTTLLAEAWFMNTGRIDYNLHAGVGDRAVISNNGAVFSGTNGHFALSNAPPVPPPATTAGTERYFFRAVILGGNASFAGEDRFDLLITLYSTIQLGGYDCAKSDGSDCVESVKIYSLGAYKLPWYAFLTNKERGYLLVQDTHPVSGSHFLEKRADKLGFSLLASTVDMRR